MRTIQGVAEMKALRPGLAGPVGLVPTMGYLHEGHLSLVRHARSENRTTVVSIFVNPTQFGPGEDFKTYPRDIPRDLGMLEGAGADIVFMPPAAEMYPPGFDTWVEVGALTRRLEGAVRPTHFRGVATVVAKLFNIVRPDRAYFGQKDAQQVAVIKKMAVDLDMNVEVIALPTVREPDGLAMSSRNTYLTPEQRQGAAALYRSLMLARELWAKGETEAALIRRRMQELIEREPLAEVQYVSIASSLTLEEQETVAPPALVSLAVKFGRTRLIDNVVLE